MASKRKLEDMLETDWRNKPIQETKHSLDSDEEDDDDNNGKSYDILDDEQIEGQEEGDAGFEGGIQITPFNMKEEMEEGHFDTDGMYHWKKEDKLIRDNWLENVNWAKIHTMKENVSENHDEDSNDLPSSAPKKFDDISVYKEMLPFMKPKETVSKTLRRLAGNKTISTAERWKRKKAGIDTTKEEEESKEKVSKLTELANKILQNLGNMDVYQESYEYISEKIEAAAKKESVAKTPELDMYADDFDTKEKERLETKETETTPKTEPAKPPEDSGDVTWEYKLEKDSTEISGPHTSEQMLTNRVPDLAGSFSYNIALSTQFLYTMLIPSNMLWKETMTTLLLLTFGMAQETTNQTSTDETTTMSSDINCKHPTYIRRPLAPDVRAASPFYVVAVTRTKKTEQIDNVCYTYFEDKYPFLHIISIVYRDGRNSQVVLKKNDIPGEPGIAEAKGLTDACLFHDYTLIPVCNQTVFVLYRCVLCGDCDQLDIGPVFGADSRVVVSADPLVSPACAGDIARSLSDTSELSGRQFLLLPNLLPPKCITTYTKPNGITLQSIGADRARATLLSRTTNLQ